jgi:acetyl-CoA C-acetyltransferase
MPALRKPAWFTTAPVFAMQKLLDKLNWAGDVDLYEVNEAFAVVAMAAMREGPAARQGQ